jgi:hypothetical protein
MLCGTMACGPALPGVLGHALARLLAQALALVLARVPWLVERSVCA